MLETVRNAVRRLSKISNCAFEFDVDGGDDDDDLTPFVNCHGVLVMVHPLGQCDRIFSILLYRDVFSHQEFGTVYYLGAEK